MPNDDGRLAVYVGETKGVHKLAGDPPKFEFILVVEPYGSSACAQTTL